MKRLALKAGTVERAKQLRRAMTKEERVLWRGMGETFPRMHFRKRVPLGPYFADFACHAARLVIEFDGGQHNEDASIAYDAARTAFLEDEGYCVVRFWNSEINTNLEGVLTMIAQHLDPPQRSQ